MKYYAIKKANGSIAIMQIAPVVEILDVKIGKKTVTEQVTAYPDIATEIAKWSEEEQRAVISHREISKDDLPADRTFREAWTDDNATSTVDVDMDKARIIHMNYIRAARSVKFKELGFPIKISAEVEAAILSPETLAQLQALRDLPQKTDLSHAETPEELKKIWPVELKEIIV